MDKNEEAICCRRFLKWYNRQHEGKYILQRAEDYFSELKDKLNWDFVAYERDNREKWFGIEMKELATTREVSMWLEFWKDLCLELSQYLAARGVQGKFKIVHPPVLHLKPRERPKLLKAFLKVVTDKETILKTDFTDIGSDIANKFANWPVEKIRNFAEYNIYHGEYRPSELLINKSPDSRCEVTSPISPIRARDAVKQHKETFNEADIKHANKQLNLAKEKGARETILLFACYPFIYEDLIKNEVQNLDSHLICDVDYIYLVDMGSRGKVVKIYPD
jgi:hypothetical protein